MISVLFSALISYTLLGICFSANSLFHEDFEGDLSQWTHERTAQNYSGVQVNCPQGPGRCLQLTRRTHAGDMFSMNISNPTDIYNKNDFIIVEFKYYVQGSGSSQTSSLWAGWTDSAQSLFYWEAVGDPTMGLSSQQAIPPVQLYDTYNIWQTVRYYVKPLSNLKFQIVFEDYDNVTSTAGSYFIDNITVTHGGYCKTGCSQCLDYSSCIACQTGYVMINQICLILDTCLSNFPLAQTGISVSSQTSGSKVTLSLTLASYNIQNCYMPILQSLDANNNPTTAPYTVTSTSTMNFVANQQQCQTNTATGEYDCKFSVTIQKDNLTVLAQISFTQSVQFSTAANTPATLTKQTLSLAPATLVVTIRAKVTACALQPGTLFTCAPLVGNQSYVYTIGTPFLLTLKIIDPSFNMTIIQPVYQGIILQDNGNGTSKPGNGTSVPLTVLRYQASPGQIIFQVSLALVPPPGCSIAVTGNTIPPKLKNLSGRFLASSPSATSTQTYAPYDHIVLTFQPSSNRSLLLSLMVTLIILVC